MHNWILLYFWLIDWFKNLNLTCLLDMLVEFYFGILLNEIKFLIYISNIYIFYISHHCLHFCHSYYKITMSVFHRVADPSLFMEWYGQWVFWANYQIQQVIRARVDTPQYANLHTFAYWLLKTQTLVMALKYIWISSIEFCHFLWHYNINLQTVSK